MTGPNNRLPVNINPSFLIRFPPFPTPPEGVDIIPFKEWKQRGIRVDPWPEGAGPEGIDSDTETDTLGIPTVPMKNVHKIDEPKSNTRKKRLRRDVSAPSAPGAQTEEGERRSYMSVHWEANELSRNYNADPRETQTDRLYGAAASFKSGRSWPAPQRLVGLVDLWELFRKFIGIPDSTKSSKKKGLGTGPVESDSEDEGMPDTSTSTTAAASGDVIVDNDGSGVITQGTLQIMQNALRDEENSSRFLDDPVESIKVFLSSYAKDKGYMYSESNYTTLPTLTTYFLAFLIRSRVFPELKRELTAAHAYSQLAEKELPATGRLGKHLPEGFGRGCVEVWGTRGSGYQCAGIVWDEGEKEKLKEGKEEGEEGIVDVDGGLVEEVAGGDGWKKVEEMETTEEWGWGNNNSGWGSGDPSAGGWGEEKEKEEDIWVLSDPGDTLLALLGPTAFPLTHTPGIVETSMRRIIEFSPPPPAGSIGKSPLCAEPSPEAVESELEKVCGKIVLGPWIGWNDSGEGYEHIKSPTISEASRGAYVSPSSPSPPPPTPEGGLKPHDPLNDSITILVSPEAYKAMDPVEGVGVGATFVQLARVVDLDSDSGEKKKKGKGKKKGKEERRFWYIDDSTLVVPSFWKSVGKKGAKEED